MSQFLILTDRLKLNFLPTEAKYVLHAPLCLWFDTSMCPTLRDYNDKYATFFADLELFTSDWFNTHRSEDLPEVVTVAHLKFLMILKNEKT